MEALEWSRSQRSGNGKRELMKRSRYDLNKVNGVLMVTERMENRKSVRKERRRTLVRRLKMDWLKG